MKPNLGFYVQKINDIVNETEAIGEEMNPFYETIREAIDQDKTASLSVEQLEEVVTVFSNGTAKYRILIDQIHSLKPPVKVLGIHKKLEKAFDQYLEGCEEMVQAIQVENKNVDRVLFDASEIKQDDTSDTISFCIQRMTQLLMK